MGNSWWDTFQRTASWTFLVYVVVGFFVLMRLFPQRGCLAMIFHFTGAMVVPYALASLVAGAPNVEKPLLIFLIWLVLLVGSAILQRTPRPDETKLPAVYPNDWEDRRQAVLERDNYRCQNCGAEENLVVHHIVSLSKGGSNELSNLVALCESCHAKIHPHLGQES